MNNSFLANENTSLSMEEKVDSKPLLREEEGKLIKILAALQTIQTTNEWSSLKEYKLDNLVKTLKSKVFTEAKKEIPDTLKLNRLSGQLEWAEKYSDLSRWEQEIRVELQRIRIMLYGKE